MTYMRNQLLRDSDWASMDHSVELRTPLVDAHLLDRMRSLLGSFSRFPGKILLARAPQNPLPRAIIERRKTGFGIPLGRWLQHGQEAAEAGGSRAWARRVARVYEGVSA